MPRKVPWHAFRTQNPLHCSGSSEEQLLTLWCVHCTTKAFIASEIRVAIASMVVSTVGQVKINWIKSICLPPNIKIITTPTDQRCLNSMVDLQASTALEFGLNGLRRFQIQSQTEGKIRCWGPDLCTSKPEDWSSQNASDQHVMLSNNTNSVFSYYMYQHGFDS